MSYVSLRPAVASDIELLLRIYASTRARELALLSWSEAEKRAFVRSQFEAQHTYYHRHFTAAEYSIILDAGLPVGRLYVDRRSDEVRVIDLTLLPEHRGVGIGSALLLSLKAEAHAAGKPLTIYVEHDNPAWRLYSRLGFEQVSELGLYRLLSARPPVTQVKMA